MKEEISFTLKILMMIQRIIRMFQNLIILIVNQQYTSIITNKKRSFIKLTLSTKPTSKKKLNSKWKTQKLMHLKSEKNKKEIEIKHYNQKLLLMKNMRDKLKIRRNRLMTKPTPL